MTSPTRTVGRWLFALVTSERNQVDPQGDLWLSVLESTAQPVSML